MIFLGKILKVWGNRGEVVADVIPTYGLEQLKKNHTLVLKSAKNSNTLQLQSCRETKRGCLFKFEGVDSINQAYKLVGYSIYTLESVEPEMVSGPGQWLNFSVSDMKGKNWGKVVEVIEHPLNPRIIVSDGGEEIDIPFQPEIIIRVDEKKGEILINPPKGLREINQ